MQRTLCRAGGAQLMIQRADRRRGRPKPCAIERVGAPPPHRSGVHYRDNRRHRGSAGWYDDVILAPQEWAAATAQRMKKATAMAAALSSARRLECAFM